MTTGGRSRVALVALLAAVLLVVVALTGGLVPGLDRGTLHLGSRPALAAPVPSRGPLLPALPLSPPLTPAGVAAVLGPALADPALGGGVAALVTDAQTGAVLLDAHAADPVVPASTTKISTAVAALTALPVPTRLTTRVLAGPQPGDVVLVGGGDPTLLGPTTPASVPVPAAGAPSPDAGPARSADLAAQIRSARAGSPPVTRVLVDDTAYTGPALAPSWSPSYVTSGDVAPVTALSFDGGRLRPDRDARAPDPALAAGTALAQLLGVPAAQVLRAPAPAGAAQLGAVVSQPVAQLVEGMLTRSDNDLAEALARQVAVVRGQPRSFDGAAAAVRAVLAGPLPGGSAGVTTALVDGSGLSHDDRLTPAAVVALLSAALRDRTGRLAPVLSGLPVAGFDGTLGDRYRDATTAPAAGKVRAKTGTLTGVSALAGLVRTAQGRLLVFDLTADAAPVGRTRAAEAALDRAATALASCGCP